MSSHKQAGIETPALLRIDTTWQRAVRSVQETAGFRVLTIEMHRRGEIARAGCAPRRQNRRRMRARGSNDASCLLLLRRLNPVPARLGLVRLRAPERAAADDGGCDRGGRDRQLGVPVPHGRPPSFDPDNKRLLSVFRKSAKTNPQAGSHPGVG
jgi:hypothetical protein